MPVTVVLIVLAVAVVGAITGTLVWLVSTRTGALAGETLAEPTRTAAHVPLAGPITPDAVDGLCFDLAVRGYRATQVDAALDRLRDALAERDAQISRLQVELDVARAAVRPGDLELGQGPVLRSASESSLWAPNVRSYQAGDVDAGPGTAGSTAGSSAAGSTAGREGTDDPGSDAAR